MRLSASPPDSFKQRSLLATWFVSPTPALRLGDKPLYCCLDPIICMYLSTITLNHLIAFRETKGEKMLIYYFSFRSSIFYFLFLPFFFFSLQGCKTFRTLRQLFKLYEDLFGAGDGGGETVRKLKMCMRDEKERRPL